MAAGIANILAEQGANLNYTVQVLDNTGMAVNLTGYHAKFQVRSTATSTGALLLSLDDQLLGGLTLGGSAGTIAISAAAAQTKALDLSGLSQVMASLAIGLDALGNAVNAVGHQAFYALEITDGSNNVTRLLQGTFLISPEVIA